MLNREQKFIKEHIFALVESDFQGDITVEYFDGINVKFDGKNAVIGCKDNVTLSRSLFLLAKDYKNGPFELEQKPKLDLLGLSLDVARNGVFTLDALKRWVVNLAAVGFTHITFNFEDMFEMEGYPRFGYMRGRYTKADLKEFNSFCEAFGIGVIPGVQSLAHMEQYLQWAEADPIKDTTNCLLVDEPKTYEFIEKQFVLMRECFPKAEYINVFLDETLTLGKGKYLALHGYVPAHELYERHCKKIFALCDKYGFRPMMSGDMFARAASKTGAFYDENANISEELLKDYPENLIICFWNYFYTDKSIYDRFIKQYKGFKRDIIMSGAIRTYDGFIEDRVLTYNASVPFLQATIENNVKRFYCCTWGDFGTETNFMRSLGALPIYSEYCYRGLDCTREDIAEVSEFLTKMPFDNMFELSALHSEFHGGTRISSKLLYTDLFFDLVNVVYDYEKFLGEVLYAKDKSKEYMALNDKHYDYYEYVYYLTKLMAKKIELLHKIRPAYKNNDREYLNFVANEELPKLLKDYAIFIEIYKKEWLRDKKANGIETILIRLGGVCEETRFRAQQLNAYLKGEIPTITELDEEVIVDNYKPWTSKIMVPSAHVI